MEKILKLTALAFIGMGSIVLLAKRIACLYLGLGTVPNGSIGVIGGADGPTAIFLTSKNTICGKLSSKVLAIVCFSVGLILYLISVVIKRKNNIGEDL